MIKHVYWSACEVPVFLSEFNENFFFEKYSDIKFYENPSSGSRVQCGQTDMTNLTVAFRASKRKEIRALQAQTPGATGDRGGKPTPWGNHNMYRTGNCNDRNNKMYRTGNCNDKNNNTLSKVIPLYSLEHLCCCTGLINIEDINNNIN
jgi:hypothetical protein